MAFRSDRRIREVDNRRIGEALRGTRFEVQRSYGTDGEGVSPSSLHQTDGDVP
jgi:hypothetical protein